MKPKRFFPDAIARSLCTAFLALILLGGCQDPPEVSDEDQTLQVRVLKVRPVTLHPTLEFTGSVVSRNIARVHPEIAGTLLAANARVGHCVRKGDVLAAIDPEDFRLRLEIASAERLKAEAEYERVLRGFRPEDVESAESSYRNMRALLEARKSNLERNRKLFEAGSMTDRDWTVFQAQLNAAEALVEKASAELSKMRTGYEAYDIRGASASVNLARANEGLALRNLRNTEIVSPIDGVVTRRSVEVGQLVGPADSLFEVQDPDSVWLLANASAKDAVRIHAGQQARLVSDVLTTQATGEVCRVGRIIRDDTRSMPVWLAWPEGAEIPPVGSFAKAYVVLDARADIITLRRDWIHLSEGRHFVWTAAGDVLEKTPVRISNDGGDRAVIEEGLAPGTRVVVSPPSSFEEGLAVLTEDYSEPDLEEPPADLTISKSDGPAR